MAMPAFELVCLGVVALYWVLRLRRADDRARVARRLALLSVAGWVGEDTVVRAYGFYGYSQAWWPMVDRAPLLVACIWPIVIDSAAQLARRLGPRVPVALATALVVLADAALIEPIAVHAGLWAWTEPGALAVPPVGVAGWALFAGAAVAFFEWVDRRRAPPAVETALVLVAPLATHAMLIALWWGALRWVSGPLPEWGAVAVAWCASAALSWAALRRRSNGAPELLPELLARLPGAAVFFALLAVVGRGAPALVAWALAFVPPYAVLVARRPQRTQWPLDEVW